MFDLNDFIATMHDVVLNAEENDVGMFDLVDIAANYIDEKLGGKEMKTYSLKEHKKFENAAESIMFEALDNEREVPIVITVGNVSIELPMCADDWEEICFALKECYEVEYGELPQTTGNTKITSQRLIHNYLRKELKYAEDNGIDLDKVYQRFARACQDDLVLSDISECIRIENDLRWSEVKCLEEDFESDKLFSIVEEEIKRYLMSKFEVCHTEDGNRQVLFFFGKHNYGEIVTFVWGDGPDDEFDDDKKETVNNYYEEIVANCNK